MDPFPKETHPSTCNYYDWSTSVEKSKTEWTKEIALPLSPRDGLSWPGWGGTLAGSSVAEAFAAGAWVVPAL